MGDDSYDDGYGGHDAYVYDPNSGTVNDVTVGPDTTDAGDNVLVYNPNTETYDDSGTNYNAFEGGNEYDSPTYDGGGAYDTGTYGTGDYGAGDYGSGDYAGAEPVDTGDITSVL
jgi:hypothetical protein